MLLITIIKSLRSFQCVHVQEFWKLEKNKNNNIINFQTQKLHNCQYRNIAMAASSSDQELRISTITH